MASYYKSCI